MAHEYVNVHVYHERNSQLSKQFSSPLLVFQILFFSFPIYKASVAGAAIHQICSVGDDVVSEELAKVYNRGQVEKGPAFPTCVSPNNIVAYNSPGAENATTAAKGDLLKM